MLLAAANRSLSEKGGGRRKPIRGSSLLSSLPIGEKEKGWFPLSDPCPFFFHPRGEGEDVLVPQEAFSVRKLESPEGLFLLCSPMSKRPHPGKISDQTEN